MIAKMTLSAVGCFLLATLIPLEAEDAKATGNTSPSISLHLVGGPAFDLQSGPAALDLVFRIKNRGEEYFFSFLDTWELEVKNGDGIYLGNFGLRERPRTQTSEDVARLGTGETASKLIAARILKKDGLHYLTFNDTYGALIRLGPMKTGKYFVRISYAQHRISQNTFAKNFLEKLAIDRSWLWDGEMASEWVEFSFKE